MRFYPVYNRTITLFLAVSILLLLPPLSLDGSSRSSGPQQTVDMVRMEIDEDAVSVDISFNGSFMSEISCRAVLIFDLGLAIEYVDLYIEPQFPDYVSVVLEDYEVRLTSEEPVYEFTANISVVAPGVSEALIATAAGLVAAIPAVIFYNYYVSWVKRLSTEMDDFSLEYLTIIERNFT